VVDGRRLDRAERSRTDAAAEVEVEGHGGADGTDGFTR
jgi:hypothetical protein